MDPLHISLPTLITILVTVGGGVWFLSRKITAIPHEIKEQIREHERGCTNYDSNTGVRIIAMQPKEGKNESSTAGSM